MVPDAAGTIRSFQGITQTTLSPPDPVIAAGPNHIITATNISFAIYAKDGTRQYSTTFGQWFSSLTPPSRLFDPKVVYDANAGRWIMLILSVEDSPQRSQYFISVSDDSDPNGSWWHWKYDAGMNGTTSSGLWADYPGLGYDSSEAVYITTNQYTYPTTSPTFQYSKVRVLYKSQLYWTGSGASLGSYDFWNFQDADGVRSFNLMPAQAGSALSGGYLLNTRPSGGTAVTLWRLTNPVAATPTIARQATVAVGSYASPPTAPQLGGGTPIDTNDCRTTDVWYQGGKLVMAFPSAYNWGSGNVSAIRTLSLNASTSALELNDTYGADGFSYYYPAVIRDSGGNLGLVFSRSSANEYGHVRYTVRWSTDTQFQSSSTLKAGEANYLNLIGTRNRWGDYFGIALDPADASTAWICGEYAWPSNQWATWIGHVPISSSAPAAPVATSASNVSSGGFTANWNSVTNVVGYRLDVSPSSTFSTYLSGYQDLDVGNVTSRSVTGLSANTTYYYRVRAYRGGTSASSNVITVAMGSLQVTIQPSGAVSAGAQWRVDGGAYQNSGATVSGLLAGNHTVSFKPITAWDTPANQTVSVPANSTATSTGTYVVQSGSLRVTITPTGAVTAGAQWSVDGGPYQNSGATVSNLYVGTHTLTFKPVSGWETPASQSVSVSANTTTNASGNYGTIASTGSLQVTISPAGAVSAGAQWQVDGGVFQNSGATVGNLSTGSHTLSFKSVSGWTTPSSQTVTINANSTTGASGTYVAVPSTGSLQVTIAPAGAVSAGAQWQVDGGAYQNSGAIVSNLSAGSHIVAFKPVSGWTTPSNQTINVTANTTATTSGTYGAVATTGSLRVTILPAEAVSAGAQWQVDGGAFQNSGATVSNLSVGNHTISFKPISGWSTPGNQIMPVDAGTTNSTSGTYVTAPTTGALRVTITPAAAVDAGAQWQVDGGPFQNSGATVSNLSVGNHTISFKPISGWTTPTNQIMPVDAGTTNATSGTYTAPTLQLVEAVSMKAHVSGTYGIILPLTGTQGVECRSGGATGNHTLVFTFSSNITSGNATVTNGVGSVSGTPSIAGNTMIVQLTGVANVQRLTVSLSNVTDTIGQVLPTTSVTLGFLVGDTSGSGAVNTTDIGQTKAQSGQSVTASNFRMDVTASGASISSSDVGLVKSAAGTQLPPQ
jgi:hypothetical protein